jgi:succinate dehydrogenase cytochrome b subunit
MSRLRQLVGTTVGKKVIMAVTGFILVAWVFAHMIGNLKVFQGPEKFNAYAEFLRTVGAPVFAHGELLWINRVGLLVLVGLPIWASIQLTRTARRARPVAYRRPVHLEDSYASRTMRWGGVIIVAFVIYHLLDLTVGSVHPGFVPGDPYDNVVRGFQVIPVAIAYIVAVTTLGFHLYHGLWSAFQTLGMPFKRREHLRRGVASLFSIILVAGFVSVPVAVMLGFIR